MYSDSKKSAKIGKVQIDIKRKSYRIRFTYPKGVRHEFVVAHATNEGWATALRAAHLINRDIDLGDFDETYARYSPSHSKSISIVSKPKTYDLLVLWLQYKEANLDVVAKTTQKSAWRHFDKMLSDTPKAYFALDKANEFISYLKTKYAIGTISNLFTKTLTPSVNRAIKLGLIPKNPYSEIRLPKQQKPKIEAFTDKEIKAIVAAFYSDEYCPKTSVFKHSHYAQFVEFLALTGCRPEEVIALKKADIKKSNDKIFVRLNKTFSNGIKSNHTKTHEIRLYPCNSQLMRLLASIQSSCELLFPSQKSSYICLNNFRRRYWKTVIEGLVRDGTIDKYLKPYCLRHSAITRWIRSGMDIATVASLAGTSTDMIVKHYLASNQSIEIPEL